MAHTKVTKTYSQNTGAANTFSYSGSFDVFKGTEVQVELDNTQLTFTASTINESASPREYTVDTSAKTIHIGGANLSSGTIIIRPVTDMGAPTPRATYAPGSSITSEDLNNNQLQLMRKAMEYDEQKLSSLGGTMTGDLTIGEDKTIIFEGATDDGYETTLTVADPTADRTITLPNVTGTVVTTGDTATITATMLAANSVDSSELVNASIDTSHIGNLQVTTDKIAADAITGAKLADDAIDSEHYADGSIDTAHIANNAVTAAKIADNTITRDQIVNDTITAGQIAANTITATELTSDSVTTAKIAADAITGAKIADNAIGPEHLANNSITGADMVAGTVDTTQLAADAVTGAKIADDSIDSEHYVDGSIDTAHIGGTQVTAAKIASNAVTTAKITDANVTTVKIADSNVTLAKLASDLKQTSISDSDTQLPTSGAVVDYVAAQLQPFGGFEAIATEVAFPNTQPASGVVISIADAGGIVVNGSGTSTTGRTVGGTTVTINNIASNFNSSTVDAGVRFLVSSTGSGQIYNYHKATLKEADILNLSNDINDFSNRYRVASSAPSSSLDDGDLWYDTSNAKMMVYSGTNSAWEEVTSTGDFYINTISSYSGTGGNSATFNGSAYRFVLSNPPTSAQQLIVSVNGVIQKPNSGTGQPSEGFALNGSSIVFSAAPATGADYFIITVGSTVAIGTPSDNTVATAKIQNLAVTTDKIAADSVTGAKIADDAVGAEHIEDLDATVKWVDSAKAIFGTGNDLEIYHNGSYSFIKDSGTGGLVINTDALYVKNAGDNEAIAYFTENGSVELYYDNAKKFETTSWGAKVTGNFVSVGHVKPHLNNTYDLGDDASRWRDVYVANDIDIKDNGKLLLGDGDDLQIYHSETSSWIRDVGTGNLYLDTNGDRISLISDGSESNGSMAKFNKDGAVELYYDGVKKLETTSAGATLSGHLQLDGHLDMSDDHYIKLGTGDDLQIYHDGSDSTIKNSTGQLTIRGDTLVLSATSAYEKYLTGTYNGAVELYYDNSKKFETTSTGVSFAGNHATFADDGMIRMGAGNDLNIWHDGTNSYIENKTGNLEFQPKQGETACKMIPDGAVELYYDDTNKLATAASGVDLKHDGTLSNNGIHLERAINTGDYSNTFGVTNYPDCSGYGDADDGYWCKLESKGGTVVILNTDGAHDSGRNNHDHFSIYQKAGDSTNGRRLFSVDNIGQVQFGRAGIRIDNSWAGQPSITVQRDNNDGTNNTDDTAYMRVHGIGETHASWTGGASGNDFSANFMIDGSTYATSDRRAKADIVDCPYGLDIVNKLQPRKFQLVNSQLTSQGPDNINLGFIAQEIKEHIPECVNYLGDEANTPNEKGWARAYAFDIGEVIPVLTKAIQELSTQVETLKTKVAALEAK